MASISTGIQVDVTVMTRRIGGKQVEVPSCDHSCWNENYKCPAATSRQAGCVTASYAPGHLLVSAIRKVAHGLRRITNVKDTVEVNLFGGNPELHPDIIKITKQLSLEGFAVCLSIPGRRFITDPEFCAALVDAGPKTIAFSADDFESPEYLGALVAASSDELSYQWRQVPYGCSQRQKAIEAIYAARALQRDPGSPTILFNLVVHPGNLWDIMIFMFVLWKHFKEALINVYPVQSAFFGSPSPFSKEHVTALKTLIEAMASGVPLGCIQRPHYWRLLKVLCELYRDDDKAFCDAVSGKGIWNCHFAGNRYVQIGRRSPGKGSKEHPGGYLNCFWNPSGYIDNNAQVWNTTDMDGWLANYGSPDCPGCLMPRLLFDEENMLKGLSEEILPAYQAVRTGVV